MPPPYPSKKADKDLLYSDMIAGIVANPVEYPNGLGAMFNTATLVSRDAAKSAAVNDRLQTEAVFRLAVEAESAAFVLADLEAKRLLGLAESQHATTPEKLLLIGWGPPADPLSVPPGAPRVLEAFPQNQTSLELDWKPPLSNSGGRVAFYRVERQTQTLTGEVTEGCGAWSTQTIRRSRMSVSCRRCQRRWRLHRKQYGGYRFVMRNT